MALTTIQNKKSPEDVRKDLDNYIKLVEQEEVLSHAYQLLLDEVINTNPERMRATSAWEKCSGELSATKDSITEAVRTQGSSVRGESVAAHYSNPKVVHYDLGTLERMQPGIVDIPNLVKRTVDMEVLEAAIAAGYIEEDPIREAKIEVPRYKNGRVQIRVTNKNS